MGQMEIAEDIVSDTFLIAAETWGLKGIPENPTAWLYTVAKNKARDHFRRQNLFDQKITADIRQSSPTSAELEIDLSEPNITDSQLKMMFAVCHPVIPQDAQIGLALRILCGFGIEEIADAFLSNKDTINKRLFRAKNKLREAEVELVFPPASEIAERLETVLMTLYLLFNEGYYSASQDVAVRKELCVEAMRLTFFLLQNPTTNTPPVNALLALMCFHSSRFDARTTQAGTLILYEDQNADLWNQELIQRGEYYLDQSAQGTQLTKYHLEARIAYWHTKKDDSKDKWEEILQLYNHLLQIEYSPMAALNRTFALAKTDGNPAAIKEAEKLNLEKLHLYHALLGELYRKVDGEKAIFHFEKAYKLARTERDKTTIRKKIAKLGN